MVSDHSLKIEDKSSMEEDGSSLNFQPPVELGSSFNYNNLQQINDLTVSLESKNKGLSKTLNFEDLKGKENQKSTRVSNMHPDLQS